MTNDGEHTSPEEFLAGAQQNKGSWWPHWMHWMNARSGERVAAPKTYGSEQHEAMEAAPGTYGHAKAKV